MSIKFLLSLSPFKGRSNKSNENDINDDNNNNDDEEKTVTWDMIRHKSQIGTSKTRLKIKTAQSWSKIRTEISQFDFIIVSKEKLFSIKGYFLVIFFSYENTKNVTFPSII
jgi:hypothetical protein